MNGSVIGSFRRPNDLSSGSDCKGPAIAIKVVAVGEVEAQRLRNPYIPTRCL